MNIFNEIHTFNNVFENEQVLDGFVAEERMHRIQVEGPPDPNLLLYFVLFFIFLFFIVKI